MSIKRPACPESAKIGPMSGRTGARRRLRVGPSGRAPTLGWLIRDAGSLLAQIAAVTPHA
eukprot:772438-Pyramimonas_sp.AAC.1